MTELGPLPESWAVASFKEATARERSRVGKVMRQDYRMVGKYPVVDQGQGYISAWTDEEEKVYKGPLPLIIFGDHTRALKFVDFPFVIGADGVKLVHPNTQRLDPRFLYYALLSVPIESRGYNRHYHQLVEKKVPVPPLTEQRMITAVLSAGQQAKEQTEAVIGAAKELKKSLMKHLFTYGPVPVAEAEKVALKETEIGQVPTCWQAVGLGDVSRIGNGSTPKRTEPRYWQDGTIPWLTSGKVYDGVITKANEYVTEYARRECHLPMVPQGSLLVAITGQGKTLGNSAILAIDACVSQHLAYVTVQDGRVLPEFLLRFLRSRYPELQAASKAGGSTKGALTCGFLKRFPIPMPPLAEQREIADALTILDARIASEECKMSVLDQFFRTLLNDLMTARIRVNDVEVPA
jgi:type I restriction enzyme S subunit